MTQGDPQPALLRLVVTEGPQSGKTLEKRGASLRVGRTTKSPFYIKDPAISEQHAELAWREGAWCLRDLGSTNGTAVNGKALAGEPSDWLALKDGDVVKFGTDTLVRVEVAAVPSASLTVEEYVLAEASQLEQRIRWVARRGQGARRRLRRMRPAARVQRAAPRQPPPAAGVDAPCRPQHCASRWQGASRMLLHPSSCSTAAAAAPPSTCCRRARAEQAANQLRQEWQEAKQTLLMG